MAEINSSPLINNLRSGQEGSEFVAYTNIPELVISGTIQLNEIPDKVQKVQIIDLATNTPYYETKNQFPTEYQYVVDYTTGLIKMNPAAEGKTLSVSYYGRGVVLTHISRIYTQQENGEVTETLGDIIQAGRDGIENINTLNTLVENTNQATTEVLNAKDQIITEVTDINTQLVAETENAVFDMNTHRDSFKYDSEAYLSTKNYKKNNLVTYNNITYICIQDTVGHVPTDTTYWRVFAGILSKVDKNMLLFTPTEKFELNRRGVDIIDYGADPNGVLDSSAALVADINDGTDMVYIPKGVFLINQNVTVPPNVRLVFAKNARIIIANGKTLTINGAIEAHSSDWIFDISFGGTIAGNPKVKEVYPEWYGAKGVTDDTSAIQAAINSGVSIVSLQKLTYLVTSPLKIINYGLTIKGGGTEYTSIKAKNAMTSIFEFSENAALGNVAVGRFKMHDLKIDGNNLATDGIWAKNLRYNNVFSRVHVHNVLQHAFNLYHNCWINRLNDCRAENIGQAGVFIGSAGNAITIKGIDIITCVDGIRLNASADLIGGVSVTGACLQHCSNAGVNAQTSSYRIDALSIVDSYFEDNTTSVILGGTVQGAHIAGNTMVVTTGVGQYNIDNLSKGATIEANTFLGSTVTAHINNRGNNMLYAAGNRVNNTGTPLIAGDISDSFIIEMVYGNAPTINGREFGFAGHNSTPTTGTHKRGAIDLNSDADVGESIGRVCITGGTPGIWKGFGSIGDTKHGVLLFSGDGVATSKIIPHGLTVRPSYVNVIAGSSSVGNAGIWYVNRDETNITVFFKSALASGVDNCVLYWDAKE